MVCGMTPLVLMQHDRGLIQNRGCYRGLIEDRGRYRGLITEPSAWPVSLITRECCDIESQNSKVKITS